jgi:histidine ammonia-lyase
MTAAIKLRRVVENTRNVLAIEAIAAAQALDFVASLKTSPRGQKAHDAIRTVCPRMEKDRAMYGDFAKVAQIIADRKLSAVLE